MDLQLKKIYFLHIRKTAGTSFNNLLRQGFEPHNICPILSEIELQQKIPKKDWGNYLNAYNYIRGHFYSIHQYLNNFYTITILRDPIKRSISAFNHITNDLTDPLNKYIGGQSIHEAIHIPELQIEFSNAQTKYLVENAGYKYNDLSDEQRIKVAMDFLLQIDFFGFQEMFETSISLLSALSGLTFKNTYVRSNTKITEQGTKDNEAYVIWSELALKNKLDLEVYKRALRIFDARVTTLFYKHQFDKTDIEKLSIEQIDLDQKILLQQAKKKNMDFNRIIYQASLHIRKFPAVARFRNFRGELLQKLSRRDEAGVDFRKAIEINPSVIRFHRNLAENLLEDGDIVAGIQKYSHILKNFDCSLELKARCLQLIFNHHKAQETQELLSLLSKNVTYKFGNEALAKQSLVNLHFEPNKILTITFPRNFLGLRLYFERLLAIEKYLKQLVPTLNAGILLDLSDNYELPSTCLCFSTNSTGGSLIPDPTFTVTDAYKEERKQIECNLIPFQERSLSVFWRGVLTGSTKNGGIDSILNLPEVKLCKAFKEFNQSLGGQFFDGKITSIGVYQLIPNLRDVLNELDIYGVDTPLSKHTNYAFLIDIDRYSRSWFELFTKLLTGSLVFKVKTNYSQWYYDELVDMQNIVFIESDFSDLKEKFVFLKNKPDVAGKIGAEGRKFALSMFVEGEWEKAIKSLRNKFGS